MLGISVLVISIVLQFIAATLAVRLIRITGKRLAWGLIATAVLLMALRRGISLLAYFGPNPPKPLDLFAETVALIISVCMVIGIARIASLFQERRRTEQALRDSEARYRLVFDNSPVSIWEEDFTGVKILLEGWKKTGITDIAAYFANHPEQVRQCAEAVRVVNLNQAALDLHGATNREELLGGLVRTFTPESFVTFREELICLWNGGTKMTSEAVVKTLAGEPRNVTVYFIVCPGYEESLARVVVSLVDISEAKSAEEARRSSEAALRIREGLLNESQRVGQVGGWDWDALHDVIWWSDEYYRLYGIAPGTPPPGYQEHLQAYTPESAARLNAAVKDAMERGKPYELDLELAQPTPTTRWIVARCEVKRDENGAIIGLRGTAHNITERKQAEAELQRLNADLEQRVRERTIELEAKNEELARMNKAFVGRELRMVELKKRIAALETQSQGAGGQDA